MKFQATVAFLLSIFTISAEAAINAKQYQYAFVAAAGFKNDGKFYLDVIRERKGRDAPQGPYFFSLYQPNGSMYTSGYPLADLSSDVTQRIETSYSVPVTFHQDGICISTATNGIDYVSLSNQEITATDGLCKGMISKKIGNVKGITQSGLSYAMGGTGASYRDLAWFARPVPFKGVFEHGRINWLSGNIARYGDCEDDWECGVSNNLCNQLVGRCDWREPGTQYSQCDKDEHCPGGGDDSYMVCGGTSCQKVSGIGCIGDYMCVSNQCVNGVCT